MTELTKEKIEAIKEDIQTTGSQFHLLRKASEIAKLLKKSADKKCNILYCSALKAVANYLSEEFDLELEEDLVDTAFREEVMNLYGGFEQLKIARKLRLGK